MAHYKHSAVSDVCMITFPGTTLAEHGVGAAWLFYGRDASSGSFVYFTSNEPAQDKQKWVCGLKFCTQGASSFPPVDCFDYSKGVKGAHQGGI